MIHAGEIKKGNYVIHEEEPHIVDTFSIEENNVKVTLKSLFSDTVKEVMLSLNECLEEANIARKTASVLFKKKGKLEIMDSYDFMVHKVKVDKNMFGTAVEGDQVTYIKFNDSVKILELRKN